MLTTALQRPTRVSAQVLQPCRPLSGPTWYLPAERSHGFTCCEAGRGAPAPHALLPELPPKCTYLTQSFELTQVSLPRKVRAQTSMLHGTTSESRCSESRERVAGPRGHVGVGDIASESEGALAGRR